MSFGDSMLVFRISDDTWEEIIDQVEKVIEEIVELRHQLGPTDETQFLHVISTICDVALCDQYLADDWSPIVANTTVTADPYISVYAEHVRQAYYVFAYRRLKSKDDKCSFLPLFSRSLSSFHSRWYSIFAFE